MPPITTYSRGLKLFGEYTIKPSVCDLEVLRLELIS